MAFEYRLILVKGGEVTVERLVGPSRFEDEIDECLYDVRDAQLYLLDSDNNELVISTDDYDDIPLVEAEVTLDKDQYVRYVCWRTSEWAITSPTALTADDVKLVRKDVAGETFVDWDIEVPGVESEFDSSWDGKSNEIIIEARDPEFIAQD